jgi:ABC-type lipoprotein release transport system permease subunit
LPLEIPAIDLRMFETGEARTSASHFRRAVVACEAVADLLTIVLAVLLGYVTYSSLALGRHIHYPTHAVLGLALASMGLYGVLAYSVARRTREIGLRIALGADRGAVARMVLRQSLVLVIVGISIGLGIAAFATRPLAMFLVPELSPTDPAAFLGVVTVLLAVALAATLGPALRAVRVDPMTALRYE